jgi:hypothetical protein
MGLGGKGISAVQMPLREVQGLIYYNQHGQIQDGRQTFIYQPFTTTDLLNWKHDTPPSWKSLRI